MRIVNVEQGSDEWFAARAGIPTASNFDQIICQDGSPSKQRQKYLYRLAAERVSGVSEEVYQNGAMARGKELEPQARKFYEFKNNVSVQQVGLCIYEGPYVCAASPDGFVGEDGGTEIKCPMGPNHVAYKLGGKLPGDYFQQVQGNLFVTGRMWWDFISYHPLIEPMIVRVTPDLEFHVKLNAALEQFCDELEKIVAKIK